MTWAGLVVRNLLRRPARTSLTAAGVALGVALIVALLSVTAGAKKTADQLIHVGRADFGLFQAGASDLTLSRLPEGLADEVARQPGVAATGRIYLYVTNAGLVFGFARGEFPAQRLVITQGRRAAGDEALVGDARARTKHLHTGDTVAVGRRRFHVAGVFHTGDPFEDGGLVLPLRVVQRLAGRPGDVTTISVAVSLGARPRGPCCSRTSRPASLRGGLPSHSAWACSAPSIRPGGPFASRRSKRSATSSAAASEPGAASRATSWRTVPAIRPGRTGVEEMPQFRHTESASVCAAGSTLPSRSRSTRSACWLTDWSFVTNSTVIRRWSRNRSSSCRISPLVSESSAPVGSSASSSRGSFASARAIATR